MSYLEDGASSAGFRNSSTISHDRYNRRVMLPMETMDSSHESRDFYNIRRGTATTESTVTSSTERRINESTISETETNMSDLAFFPRHPSSADTWGYDATKHFSTLDTVPADGDDDPQNPFKFDVNAPFSAPDDLETWNVADKFHKIKFLHWLRSQGANVKYESFEGKFVGPMNRCTNKQQVIPQLGMLAIFILWILGTGGWLTYRLWGLYVGYSPKWHLTSIHQDLRFDAGIWRLYGVSLMFLLVGFAFLTTVCLRGAGEEWWKELIAFGCIRTLEGVKLLREHMYSGAIAQSEVKDVKQSQQQRDYEWEEKMVKKYRQRIWWWVCCIFLVYPIGMIAAYCSIVMMKDKCWKHAWDAEAGYVF
ncbi:hypothetical protein BDZ91DRAFT_723894 [Kalaharituber pfeilii]|nr:hypothetical protein BDZ91DRAFT_723894 [Kalaharituber pfeilii]